MNDNGGIITVVPAFDGFFHEPKEPFRAPFVDDHDFRHVPLAGLAGSIQFFRFTAVESDGRSSIHLVLTGVQLTAEASFAPAQVVLQAFPGAVVAVVLEARTGHARATCHAVAERHASAVAACIATMLATASWDESNPIAIDLDADGFDVSLEFQTGAGWVARVNSK